MSRVPGSGAELYREIATELGDPSMTLEDLDPECVTAARDWARRNRKRWPPRPAGGDGWQVHFTAGP